MGDSGVYHYNNVGDETAALAKFRTFTKDQVLPELDAILTSTTKSEMETKMSALRSGGTMGDWRAEFSTFATPHATATYDEASDIATPVMQKLQSIAQKMSTLPAGGKRKYSRKYCKKTPCRKMGFTQKASCRPYKNCFTRRGRRSGY